MPELPDLHVFSKNLKKRIAHKRIETVDLFNISKLNVLADKMKKELLETEIIDIVRDGKELFFQLGNGSVFSVHLMLNGKFDICNAEDVQKINSKIIAIGFEDKQLLVISDYQGLCKVALNPLNKNVPDALGESFTFEYLQNSAAKNGRMNIKAFLITQGIIKGIGNAYADEILWQANISPASTVGKIPPERLKDLHAAVGFILKDAIANIERISPDIIRGEVRSFLRVHNPKKKYTDEGAQILVKKIASKTTYYTEKQTLFI